MTKKSPKFEYWRGNHPDDPYQVRQQIQWYWHLRAANGEIIAQGEAYATERGVLRGIAAVQRAVGEALVRERRVD